MEIRRYARILGSHWWVILLTTVVAFGIVAVITYLTTPIYSASALVRVAQAQSGSVSYVELGYTDRVMQTYAQMLTSRPVLTEVIGRLGLAIDPLDLAKDIQGEVVQNTELVRITVNTPEAAQADAERLLYQIMEKRYRDDFEKDNDTDLAYEIPGVARFRVNIFLDRKGMGWVFRVIPTKVVTVEDLNISMAIQNLCNLNKGLVLVTGPTGSGKTTSLYTALQSLNRPYVKIITVEDPIEYQLAGINQVAVNADTGMTFATALRAMLRQAAAAAGLGGLLERLAFRSSDRYGRAAVHDELEALITAAGNPVLSTPNGAALERALPGLDLLVSIDFYINETTRHAHVVLPVALLAQHLRQALRGRRLDQLGVLIGRKGRAAAGQGIADLVDG